MTGETVLVEYLGNWLPGRVLWEYSDTRRRRALVRYELPSGQIVRRLHWRSELRRTCFVIELDLRQVAWPALATLPGWRHPDSARMVR